ncbi:MAG: CdaR family protein [Thermacetogeniaceae bacterium]
MRARGESWFVRYNIGYRLLALLLALLLWYFVTGQRNPVVERTFTKQAEARYVPREMVLTSVLPEIRVTVSGLRNILQTITEDDIEVYVDLSGRSDGVSFVQVKAKVPPELHVVRIEPERIKVSLDYLEEKSVPVNLSLAGVAAPGFVFSSPEVTPERVVIRGPSRMIRGIQDVHASLNVDGAREDIKQRVRVRVEQKDTSLLEIRPEVVEVYVPVVPQWPTKTVPVVADLEGKPKAGFSVKGAVTEPASVEITGAPQAVASVSQLHTKPVDISGADGRIVREAEIAFPSGIYPVRDEKVRVIVDIAGEEKEQLSSD